MLVLDDEKNIRNAIEIALDQEGMHVIAAHDVAAALRMLHERIVDVMIIDIRLGEVSGLDFFRRVQADGIAAPAIFISGHATLTEAAQAVKMGGFDFLEKPFSAEKIAVVGAALPGDVDPARAAAPGGGARTTREIVGDSAVMRRLVQDTVKVARTSASVLITGESGAGKELIANCIHANSDRAQQPFVKVNCSAIPESLIESELFGHETRRVHRRHRGAQGSVRSRASRRDLSRRDRRSGRERAGKDPAGPAERRDPARRRGAARPWSTCACCPARTRI